MGLACMWLGRTKALANQMEILCIKYQQGPVNMKLLVWQQEEIYLDYDSILLQSQKFRSCLMYETRIINKRCRNMPQKFEIYFLCVCVRGTSDNKTYRKIFLIQTKRNNLSDSFCYLLPHDFRNHRTPDRIL